VNYLSHTDDDRAAMLAAVGVVSIDELFGPIPPELCIDGLPLPPGLSELEVRQTMQALAARNTPPGRLSFLGGGCEQHHLPAAVRALTGRAEFETAYTPYQAEVSQGTLQSIFEFQTAVCELTGLDVANASLYDGASALAEGCFLALRHTRRERIVLSTGMHPEALEVVRTYASGPGLGIDLLPLEADGRTTVPDPATLATAGILAVQQPNFFGVVEDVSAFAAAAHAAGALLVVSQNPMTLGVLASPGSLGADVAVGDVQPFGNPMSYGGPSAGYLACRSGFLRQLPGRLVGETTDNDGQRCYALTLQAREQHIRRAKATSNVCTNQALCALAATIHLSLLGPTGLREVGEICLQRAHSLQARLASLPSVSPLWNASFFHEFAVELPIDAETFRGAMRARGIDPGIPLARFFPDLGNALLVTVTEMNGPDDLDLYASTARDVLAGAR
jgi:glycine dehydrogenase subunit 1